jgi:hypothetical protein
VRGRQRFLCKDCGRHYTLDFKQLVDAHAEQKRLARWGLMLYLSGFSKRQVANILNVSHPTVISWIKKYGVGLNRVRGMKKARSVVLKSSPYHRSGLPKVEAGAAGLLLIEQKNSDTLVSLSSGKRDVKDIWDSVYKYEYYDVKDRQDDV